VDEHIDPAELCTLPLSSVVLLAFVLILHGAAPSVRKIHRLTGHSFRDINSILHILREP
jgi:hypothetical protein